MEKLLTHIEDNTDSIEQQVMHPAINKLRERAFSIVSQDAFGSSIVISQSVKGDVLGTESDDDVPQTTAPDGGYGWVIAGACFMVFTFLSVPFLSFGVLYLPIVEYFDSDKGVTGWIGSLYAFTGNILGIIIGAFVKRFGCRSVALVGCVLMSTGFALSALLISVPYLYVTHGFIAGIGGGVIFLPAMVTIQQYFDKKRALAVGMSTSGLSIAGLFGAPMIEAVLNEYGLRGSYLLLAGLVLQNAVFISLFRPIEHRKRRKNPERGTPEEKKAICNEDKQSTINICKDKVMLGIDQEDSNNFQIAHIEDATSVTTDCCAEGTQSTNEFRPNAGLSGCTLGNVNVSPMVTCNESKEIEIDEASISICEDVDVCDNSNNSDTMVDSYENSQEVNSHEQVTEPGDNATGYITDSSTNMIANYSASPEEEDISNINNKKNIAKDVEPISYSHEESVCVHLCKDLMDFKVLKDVKFVLYLLGTFGFNFGMISFITHYISYAVSTGISRQTAIIMQMIISVGIICGRYLAMGVANLTCTDLVLMYGVIITVSAIGIITLPLVTQFALLLTYATMNGVLAGCVFCIQPMVLVDIAGMDHITKTMGFLHMTIAVSILLTVPLAGFLYDVTGTYHLSFIVVGSVQLMGGILLVVVAILKSKDKHKTK